MVPTAATAVRDRRRGQQDAERGAGRISDEDQGGPVASTETMQILVDTLGDCVAGGYSTSTDPSADAVALRLGLHGLAHQRAVTRAFPWPEDIEDRIITTLAHLDPADA